MAEYFHLAESQIISLLLTNEENRDEFFTKVSPGVFPSNVGRSLYLQIRKFHSEGEDWDDSKLILTCKIEGLNKRVLTSIRDEDAEWDSLDLYLEALRYHKAGSLLKHKISSLHDDKKKSFNKKDIEDLKKVLDDAIYTIREEETPDDIVEGSNFSDRVDGLLLNNSNASDDDRYSLGCDMVDALVLKKGKPGFITSIFGPTGGGKSTFGFHLFTGRVNKDLPSLWLSTENDIDMMLERFISKESKIPMSELQTPESLAMSDKQKIEDLKHRLAKKNCFEIHYKPSLTMAKVREIVKSFELKTGYENPVVFIDLFTMIREVKLARTPKDVEAAVDDLHVLADELRVHFVIVLQSRRRTLKKEGTKVDIYELLKFRPSIDEVKNSGAFAERSRAVLSVFNKRNMALNINPEMKEDILASIPDVLEICVAKQNQGAIGEIIEYALEGEISRLTPYFEN